MMLIVKRMRSAIMCSVEENQEATRRLKCNVHNFKFNHL